MRDIFLDTETTGLDVKGGHRIVEVAAAVYENGKPTGEAFHHFVDPGRVIPEDVIRVHGITNEMVRGKPRWEDINDAFCEFIRGGRILAHNADFDTGFVVMEMTRCNSRESLWSLVQDVVNTETEFRKYDPGQRSYSLDSVAGRFKVDTSSRADRHGALIDVRILADTYYTVRAASQHAIFDYQAISKDYAPSRLAAHHVFATVTPSSEALAADAAFRAKFMPAPAEAKPAPRKAPSP